MLTLGILGPVEVVADGRPIPLGPPQQRALLAVLLLDANRVVAVDTLIGALWGDEPPASARNLLQGYVSRLRRALAPLAGDGVHVRTRAPGYLLEVDPALIDAERFERCRRADGNGPAGRAERLAEALAHWRGPALADVAAHPGLVAAAARLDELRLVTTEDRLDAELAGGRHADLVAELPGLIVRHPYRERLHAALILALYRSGRQADALAAYRAARARLVEDLGLEPGPDLRGLEAAILRQDRRLAYPEPAGIEQPPATPPAPHPPPGDEQPPATPPSRPPPAPRRRLARLLAAVLLLSLAVTAAVLLAADRDEPALRIAAGDLGFIDADGGRLTRVLAAGGEGGPLAVADERAWVADQAARTVTSVDLVRGTARPYGVGAAPTALVAGGGSVWVGGGFTGTLSRILPAEDFVGSPFRPAPTTTGRLALALDGQTLWIGSQDRRLVALETAGTRIRSVVRLPRGPRAIVKASGAVWAALYGDRSLLRVDATTGALRRGAALGGLPVALATGAGALWVATGGDNRVWRVDARDGEPLDGIPVGEPPTALAVSAGAVWVGGAGGTVVRIDPRTRAVVATVRVGLPVAGLAADRSGVWVGVK